MGGVGYSGYQKRGVGCRDTHRWGVVCDTTSVVGMYQLILADLVPISYSQRNRANGGCGVWHYLRWGITMGGVGYGDGYPIIFAYARVANLVPKLIKIILM